LNRKIVAILNYRSSRGILNVVSLLEKAGKKGKVRPRNWEQLLNRFRSLTVYEDGSCLLHTLSAASMIRRRRKVCL
jgi:hypothetical protein